MIGEMVQLNAGPDAQGSFAEMASLDVYFQEPL